MFWLLVLGAAAWWFGWFDWFTTENWLGSLMLLVGIVAVSVGTPVLLERWFGRRDD